MNNEKVCPHCNEHFEDINVKVFANHVRWCKCNPNKSRLSGNAYKETMRKSMEKRFNEKLGEVKEFKVKCHMCGNDFIVYEREHQFPSKERYFCSLDCGHKYSASCAYPKKIGEGVKKHNLEHGITVRTKNGIEHRKYIPQIEVEKECPCCHNTFTTLDFDRECCSLSCTKKMRDIRSFNLKIQNASEFEKEKLRLKKYRQDCSFRFSLKDYPNEFDFKLIKEFGWYYAKNRGNNPNGVSRDHMYSVKQGFLNGIDPKIISHPANCRLVRQCENASKGDGCIITLEELLDRIRIWDNKYQVKTN